MYIAYILTVISLRLNLYKYLLKNVLYIKKTKENVFQ